MTTLKSRIPNDFQYSVGKIYEGIYNDYPLAKMNFEAVKDTCESLKTEIDLQYNLKSLSGAKEIFRQIDYVLDRIEVWINANQLLNNHDAEVFLDAFKDYFTELEGMLDEMDRGEVQKR